MGDQVTPQTKLPNWSIWNGGIFGAPRWWSPEVQLRWRDSIAAEVLFGWLR